MMDYEGRPLTDYEGQRIIRINEFCKRYQICRTRAYEEINAGRLKAYKVGSATVIRIADAEAWVAALPPLVPRKPCRPDNPGLAVA